LTVAQICNLLYRRIAFGKACGQSEAPSNPWRIANPRYSRLKICATPALRLPAPSGYSSPVIPRDKNPRIERVKCELRATGEKPDAANVLRSGIHTRGYLPHVKR